MLKIQGLALYVLNPARNLKQHWFRRSRKADYDRPRHQRRLIEFAVLSSAVVLADPTATSLIVGAIVSVLGEGLRIAAAGYGYNIGDVSVRGPYRFLRHPHLLGTALFCWGICLAGRNPYAMGLGMVLIGILLHIEAKRDEQRLSRRLGPGYAEYHFNVPAFMPQLWPLAPNRHDKRLFSLRYALFVGRHREFNAVLTLALVFAALYLRYAVVAEDVFQIAVLVAVILYLLGRFLYYGLRGQTTY